MSTKTKKSLSVVGNVALWIFLIFAVVITVYATIAVSSSDGVPSVGGTVIIAVQSDSMEGPRGFDTGSLIFSKKITREEASNLSVDAVITYKIDLNGDGVDELNTHRIIEIVSKNGDLVNYRTQGDNKPVADPNLVNSADIVAIWEGSEIRGVGAVLTFLTSTYGFLFIIVLPLLVFFAFELVNFIRVLRQASGKKTITAADEEEIKRRAVEEYLRLQKEQASAPADKPSDSE